MGDLGITGFLVFQVHHFVCFLGRGLGGFASVGSRNALHVVGVTPVLHVVRSCTTVMAMGIVNSILLGNTDYGYYVVLWYSFKYVFIIPR